MLTPNRKHALGEPAPTWPCSSCKAPNDPINKACVMCGKARAKKKPSKRYRESQDQKALVAHMRAAGELVIRMEQGEEREPWITQLHKALGLEPGAADLLWVRPRGRVVFIECKADDGELRDTQIAHHAVLRRMGHVILTAYGREALIAAYEEHKRAFPDGVNYGI